MPSDYRKICNRAITAAPLVDEGALAIIDVRLPPRTFMAVRHKDRHPSAAGRELMRFCAGD